MSIESQSSNESGYGGSSPVFSRQNSNSTLTFNQETATVSFTASQPPSQSSPHPSLDSASSRRSHPRDVPHPDNSINSSPRNPSNRREFSEPAHQNPTSHSDTEPSHRHSGHQRDTYDTTYASPAKDTPDLCESYSTHRSDRSQRYRDTARSYSSYQWRNGDNATQKRPTYNRDEYIEPESEPDDLDGHQVRSAASRPSNIKHVPNLQSRRGLFCDCFFILYQNNQKTELTKNNWNR